MSGKHGTYMGLSIRLQCWLTVFLCFSLFLSVQEEYRAEGISWHNIDYIDNTGCINLISKKPTALFHLLDEESK